MRYDQEAMRMAKLTIFLPDELLAEIDAHAAREDRSRSSVIREASAHYLASTQSAEADARRRAAVDESLALFDELVAAPSLDGRPGLEILREARGALERKPRRP
ncbi:MAG: ribbon-helix-helix protein, CopG family [Anaerosomatales bacterium]|nr:ribbon-helix-helix protein, CopG family [Anaerosomatales bacterium]